ncbi:unnamed protein product [Somion occarium]|uniref:Uncharacterized protein n=1 Tax=Somion occarium TaxID=3059160 RepID=A0ABP1CXQ0_9APHY
MGRWTLDHHDDVLRSKLKSLVAGACKRAQLEKGEPSITYEAFVEELDEGDSFTTSLIDVLVKEMAERRIRPNPNDRRLISERTAKTLRAQAAPLHIYRGRTARLPNRRFNASDYLSAPPDELELSASDEDLDTFAQTSSGLEGVRLNSELYDAFLPVSYHSMDGGLGGNGESSSHAAAGSASTPELDREGVTSPRPVSPPFSGFQARNQGGFWVTSSSFGSGANTTRPQRRPVRSRTIDFNDFTLRRRSTMRQSSSQNSDHNARSEDPADGTWRFAPFPGRGEDESATTRSTSRRFFGSISGHRRHEVGSGEPWSSEPREPSPLPIPPPRSVSENVESHTSTGQSSSQLWFSLTNHNMSNPTINSVPASGTPTGSDPGDERRLAVAPRLRRGGIRSLPSPLTSEPTHSDAEVGESGTGENSQAGRPSSNSPTQELERNLDDFVSGSEGHEVWAAQEARQLLTPRSVSPIGGSMD